MNESQWGGSKCISNNLFAIFFNFILIVGAWSVYPFFPSGNMIVQSIEKGLFVMKVSYFFCYLILLITFFKYMVAFYFN